MTEAFLRRLLVLRRKGRAHSDALARALKEHQRSMSGPVNETAARSIDQDWNIDAPVTLAFDIDGTLNPSGRPGRLWRRLRDEVRPPRERLRVRLLHERLHG